MSINNYILNLLNIKVIVLLPTPNNSAIKIWVSHIS